MTLWLQVRVTNTDAANPEGTPALGPLVRFVCCLGDWEVISSELIAAIGDKVLQLSVQVARSAEQIARSVQNGTFDVDHADIATECI